MILDACFEIPELQDSIFKYCSNQKHRTKNVKKKTYKKNMFKVCGTKSRRYCIDLDSYISKKKTKNKTSL